MVTSRFAPRRHYLPDDPPTYTEWDVKVATNTELAGSCVPKCADGKVFDPVNMRCSCPSIEATDTPTYFIGGLCKQCPAPPGKSKFVVDNQDTQEGHCECPDDLPNWHAASSTCQAPCPESAPTWDGTKQECIRICEGGKIWRPPTFAVVTSFASVAEADSNAATVTAFCTKNKRKETHVDIKIVTEIYTHQRNKPVRKNMIAVWCWGDHKDGSLRIRS